MTTLVFAWHPTTDADRFAVVFGALARWAATTAQATLAQCEALSVALPCGVVVPETDVRARRLVRAGLVLVPQREEAAVRAALDAARALIEGNARRLEALPTSSPDLSETKGRVSYGG